MQCRCLIRNKVAPSVCRTYRGRLARRMQHPRAVACQLAGSGFQRARFASSIRARIAGITARRPTLTLALSSETARARVVPPSHLQVLPAVDRAPLHRLFSSTFQRSVQHGLADMAGRERGPRGWPGVGPADSAPSPHAQGSPCSHLSSPRRAGRRGTDGRSLSAVAPRPPLQHPRTT